MRPHVVLYLCVLLCGSGLFAQVPHPQPGTEGSALVYRDEAGRIAASLDDASLAAQVLLSGIDGKLSLVPAMKTLLERIPAGGIMLFGYNLDSTKGEVKKLLSDTGSLVSAKTGIPPFMAVDHEGGLVHRFGPGVERLPSAYSFWELAQKQGRAAALARAETLYIASAKEIRDLGITMVLGPVLEVLDEDNRIFLETRSYGPDPVFVQDAASVFIKSMNAAGIAAAAKHFPGNSAADPHTGTSVIKAEKRILDDKVKPFARIIWSLKPQAVMVSHVMVPVLDSKNPASLSSRVMQNWLRTELGFEGIILADDFSMAAVSSLGLSPSSAAVEALNAGADMIMCWPKDLNATHAAILNALKQGRLSRARLLDAAGRIISEKIRCGLILPKESP